MKKVIKKKLEETKQHAFEKKVLQREKAKGAPRVGEFYKENDILLEDIDLGQIRIDMKREGEDITTEEIIETTKIIPLKDHMIEIIIYERKDQKDSKEKRNLVLFVHGGGFIGGDVKTKGNQCRYLAQQSGAVVVSPEYRLAPETPYPGAEEDVLGTIDWLEDNADRFNIDTDKMAIMGESAGGHLAVNACLKDIMKISISPFFIFSFMYSNLLNDVPDILSSIITSTIFVSPFFAQNSSSISLCVSILSYFSP